MVGAHGSPAPITGVVGDDGLLVGDAGEAAVREPEKLLLRLKPPSPGGAVRGDEAGDGCGCAAATFGPPAAG